MGNAHIPNGPDRVYFIPINIKHISGNDHIWAYRVSHLDLHIWTSRHRSLDIPTWRRLDHYLDIHIWSWSMSLHLTSQTLYSWPVLTSHDVRARSAQQNSMLKKCPCAHIYVHDLRLKSEVVRASLVPPSGPCVTSLSTSEESLVFVYNGLSDPV